MHDDYVLRTTHLKKYFGNVHAVEDISLNVRRGEVMGFLGPNGAGKTTTIGMILGLTYPSAGAVSVFGEPVTPIHNKVLLRVGTMVGAPSLLTAFSARQNLEFMATLYPDLPPRRIDEVLELVGLTKDARRKARTFSTGMKQRLGLALALLSKPELLVLDEPTNGMDPAGMHEIRTLLRGLAGQGVTVLLSSHLLHEMELVCDRVAVIKQGRIVTEGQVSDLLNSQGRVRVETPEPTQTAAALQALPQAHAIETHETYVEVQGVSSETVIYHLVHQNLTPTGVSNVHADLESLFLELTTA